MKHQRITTDRHAIQLAATRTPLFWGDLVALARSNHLLGKFWIARLHDEAQALVEKRYADWRINEAIASAAQGYLDVHEYPSDAAQYLDELDVLLFPEDEPELTGGFVERVSPSIYGQYR